MYESKYLMRTFMKVRSRADFHCRVPIYHPNYPFCGRHEFTRGQHVPRHTRICIRYARMQNN